MEQEGITWYDVLGVLPGVETGRIEREYEAKSALLRPDMIAGAPSNVLTAITRAQDILDRAWEVLGDPVSRRRYDEAVGIRRSGGGLGQPGTGLSDSRLGPVDLGIAGDLPLVADLLTLVGGVLALGGDPVRKPRPSRPVAVPDVRGLFYPVCVEVARRYRLQVRVVRLTERPMPVDGLVVGQDPPPGAVRQGGQLTVQIWHPHAR
jgi:DnaJ-class molecular chaperone